MRPSALALLAAAAPLAGCLSVTPRVLVSGEPDPYLHQVYPADTPTAPVLVGGSVGAQAFGGVFGIEAGALTGRATGTNAAGAAATTRVHVEDVSLLLAYPARAGATTLLVGADWTLRRTTLAGVEETAFVLRPKLALPLAVGRFVVAPFAGYDLPVLVNGVVAEGAAGTTRAGMGGLNTGVALMLGCGC